MQFAKAEFCRLLGYTADELAGKTWQELTHPDDIDADLALARRTLSGELPHYTLEKRYLRKDGSPVWVTLFGNFIHDEHGQPMGGVGVAIDMSELRRTQRQLTAVLASIDDHLVAYDPQWRFSFVNAGAEKILGMAKEDLLGKCVWDVFPEAVGNEHYEAVHRAVRDRAPQHFEFFYPPMGRWFENRVYPLEDGVTVFAVDITARKATERALAETEARFRRAVHACPLPMMIHADDGEVVEINPAWLEQSGYDAQQVRTTRDWLRITGQANAEQILHALFERDDASHEGAFNVRVASGECLTWDFRSALLGTDTRGRRLVLSIATDVTERLRSEQAQQEAARRKDEFIAMLAHELRNPLSPMKNAAYVLRSADGTSPALSSAANIIDRQVSHMARLVDDLLDVARITQGRIQLRREPCDFGRIVESVAGDHRGSAERAGLHFECAPPADTLWVDGDATRLTQVVGNLLHNALKFTAQGSTAHRPAECRER